MTFIIFGLILLVAASAVGKTTPQFSPFRKPVAGLGLGLILLGVFTSCIAQIDTGHVGVKRLFGKVQPGILREGLNFKNPLVEITEVDIRTQNYTMTGIQDERQKGSDDAIHVLSADGLEVVIDLTVLYHVVASEAPRLLRETGLDYEDRVVRPQARTKIRDNAVFYDAVALYSTRREEFQTRIVRTIEEVFRKRGLLLESLLIRNITLPAAVKGSIEQKIQAEQDAQKMRFVLQKETQEADRKRVEAQGIADYQRIVNANLTDAQLQYEQIKAMRELATSSNAKVVIMGSGKGAPIILDAK